ncbi:MAG: Fic family protein [Actinobacteria bacterium]|nr:Fic family protein [Actinomycetota bacterium]
MDAEAFSEAQRGYLRRHPGGYLAFVPPSLPPELELAPDLVNALSEADRNLGLLAGAGEWLPNPHLLIRSFVKREAVLSSRIEGTQASIVDLVLFEASPRTSTVSDVREVANYVRALELGVHEDRVLPISLRLMRDLHRELITGIGGAHLTPGEFRTSQNWIGPPGCTLNQASYVPPPPEDMRDALDAFEKYLHAKSDFPPLIRLAIVHYQFEAIHPFLDGNGRVGRLLVTLLLHEWRLLPQPLLYLSAFFERHRNDYYRLLLGVSLAGDWEEWITFFLTGIAEQSADVVERARRLLALRERYRSELHTARSSALPLKLVDHLFEQPALNLAQARELLGVSARAASMNVQKLEEAGIVVEVTKRARNRVYVADEILDLIREP